MSTDQSANIDLLFPPSREWVIDERMSELLSKKLAGTATDKEWYEYQILGAERATRMMKKRPPIFQGQRRKY